MSYRVTAPYVTLKVRDASGGPVVVGFYAGAIVPDDVDAASLKHHLNHKLVEEVAAPQPEKPAPSQARAASHRS